MTDTAKKTIQEINREQRFGLIAYEKNAMRPKNTINTTSSSDDENTPPRSSKNLVKHIRFIKQKKGKSPVQKLPKPIKPVTPPRTATAAVQKLEEPIDRIIMKVSRACAQIHNKSVNMRLLRIKYMNHVEDLLKYHDLNESQKEKLRQAKNKLAITYSDEIVEGIQNLTLQDRNESAQGPKPKMSRINFLSRQRETNNNSDDSIEGRKRKVPKINKTRYSH